MSSKIEKLLPELVTQKIISEEQAIQIRQHIDSKKIKSNFLLAIYGILGALLVSLGIISIVAHNWDQLSKGTKLVFAFLPLLIGQAGCLFGIIKKKNSVFKESFATFLFFAIATTISMVAQVYNISGDFEKFLLTWCLLALPVVYLVPSSMTSLLYIALATVYGCNAGYQSNSQKTFWFWLLLLAAVPYALDHFKKTASNFTTWHLWFYCAAITILAGTFDYRLEEYTFMNYVFLFSAYLLLSQYDFFKNRRIIAQPFYLAGIAGTFTMLLAASFDWYWKELMRMKELHFSLNNPEVLCWIVLSVICISLLIHLLRKINYKEFNPVSWSFAVFALCFFTGFGNPATSVLIINAWIFYLGVRFIYTGSRENNLLMVNFGLIVITSLIICRYFDTSISFLLRGIGFLAIGAGFFIANYNILQKRKKETQNIQ